MYLYSMNKLDAYVPLLTLCDLHKVVIHDDNQLLQEQYLAHYLKFPLLLHTSEMTEIQMQMMMIVHTNKGS